MLHVRDAVWSFDPEAATNGLGGSTTSDEHSGTRHSRVTFFLVPRIAVHAELTVLVGDVSHIMYYFKNYNTHVFPHGW